MWPVPMPINQLNPDLRSEFMGRIENIYLRKDVILSAI